MDVSFPPKILSAFIVSINSKIFSVCHHSTSFICIFCYISPPISPSDLHTSAPLAPSSSDNDPDSSQWRKLQMCRKVFCKRIGGLRPCLADTKPGHLAGLGGGFFQRHLCACICLSMHLCVRQREGHSTNDEGELKSETSETSFHLYS